MIVTCGLQSSTCSPHTLISLIRSLIVIAPKFFHDHTDRAVIVHYHYIRFVIVTCGLQLYVHESSNLMLEVGRKY